MILGVDHLALSASDLDAAAAKLQAAGYRLVFAERRVPNAEAKRGLLGRFEPWHDLALLRPAAGGVAIEVTVHAQVRGEAVAPYDIDADQAIRLRTPAAQDDREFLVRQLGFTTDGDDLVLPSPVPAWRARLRLQAEASLQPATLDTAGHPCLALLCKSLDQELVRSIAAGATDSTGVFSLLVNQRALRIALFRLPGGGLIELIEPNGRPS